MASTRVLIACTGNICRSPAGEVLLQHHLGADATVTSAGTHALVGHGIPAPMLSLLAADGHDGTAHQATQLTTEGIAAAHLVVAMAEHHRQWILAQVPTALHRTYLLTELEAARAAGAVLEGASVRERLASLPSAVAAARPAMAALRFGDVPDPYRRGDGAYADSYALIAQTSAQVGPWLTGRSPASR